MDPETGLITTNTPGYRSSCCDVLGMSNMPEAKLTQDAGLHYASVAMVTDYNCCGSGEVAVDVT